MNQRQPYRRQAAGRPGGSRLKAVDHVTCLWGGSCRALAVRDNPGGRCPRLPEVRPGRREYRPRARRSRLLALSRAARRRSSASTPPDSTSEAPRPLHGAAQAPWHEGRRVPRDPSLGGDPGGGHAPGLASSHMAQDWRCRCASCCPSCLPASAPRPPPPWHDVAGDVSPETIRYVGERYLAYTCM